MSQPKPPYPAKLVIGLFLREKELIGQVVKDLMARFGALDLVSSWIPFDFTSYYAAEMGSPLFRRIMVFQKLIQQSTLPGIKRLTNGIEEQYVQAEKRRVNIDPGYLLAERFVLATGKNYAHRIYIGDGIYADLTLVYQKGVFQTLPWTYPDYADSRLQGFLEMARSRYMADLRKIKETKI